MEYIDTSLLVAYYCPERLSTAAQKAIREASAPTISPLVDVEVHSAIALKVRTRELDGAEAARVLAQFRLHVADGRYRLVPIEAREYGLARDWIGRLSTSLRTLDALHLAAAFANGLELLTTDKPFAGAAKHFGVKCHLIV